MFKMILKNEIAWLVIIAVLGYFAFVPHSFASTLTAGQFNGATLSQPFAYGNESYVHYTVSAGDMSSFTTGNNVVLKIKPNQDFGIASFSINSTLVTNSTDPASAINLGYATSSWDGTYETFTFYPSFFSHYGMGADFNGAVFEFFLNNTAGSLTNFKLYGLAGSSGMQWYFWNGTPTHMDTNTQAPYFEFSQTSPTSSISLAWPNATTTPDFTNWVVSQYADGVLDATIGVEYWKNAPYVTPVHYTDSFGISLPSGGPELLSIPKTNRLENGFFDNYSWSAKPYFIPVGTSTKTYGSEFEFFVGNAFSVPPASTSTNMAGPFNPQTFAHAYSSSTPFTFLNLPTGCTATSTFDFWSISDWKCGAELTINDVVASVVRGAELTMQSIANFFKNIFPISTLVTIHTDIQSLSATTTDVQIELYSTSTFGGRHMKLLSSSTTGWIQNNLHFDYKTLFDYIIYAGVGIIILWSSIHQIRKMAED